MDQMRMQSKQAKTDCKTRTPKSSFSESDFDDLKKTAARALSRMTKSPSIKSSCLCSPTTHIGSFRCRRHRSTAVSWGGSSSVGSNLSDLVQKPGAMEDSTEGQ